MADYVTTIPAFVCGELPAREVSSFCDLKKYDLLQLHSYPSWLKQTFVF